MTALWKCSACNFETDDNQKILDVSPIIKGIRYLTCPQCKAVGEFIDAPVLKSCAREKS